MFVQRGLGSTTHPRSPIRVIAVHMEKPCSLIYPMSAQRKPWSEFALGVHVRRACLKYVLSRCGSFNQNLPNDRYHFWNVKIVIGPVYHENRIPLDFVSHNNAIMERHVHSLYKCIYLHLVDATIVCINASVRRTLYLHTTTHLIPQNERYV